MMLAVLLITVFIVASLPELLSIRLNHILLNPTLVVERILSFFRRASESIAARDGTFFIYLAGRTERDFIAEFVPYWTNSLTFLLGGLLIGGVLGVTVGIIIGRRDMHRLEHLLGTLGVIPDFLLALLLQLVTIAITVTTGFRVARVASYGSNTALLLPMILMALYPAVSFLLITVDRIHHFRGEHFVVNLLGRGIPERRIYRVHLLPGIIAAVEASLPRILGTAVATLFIAEQVFQSKGLVRWMFTYLFLSRGALQLGEYQFDFAVLCLLALASVVLVTYIVLRLVMRGAVAVIGHV